MIVQRPPNVPSVPTGDRTRGTLGVYPSLWLSLILTGTPIFARDVALRQHVEGTWVASDGQGTTISYDLRPDGSYSYAAVADMPKFAYTLTIREEGRYQVHGTAITFHPSEKKQTVVQGGKSAVKDLSASARRSLWVIDRAAGNRPCLLLKDHESAEPSAYCRPSDTPGSQTKPPGPGHFREAAQGALLLSLLVSPVLAGVASALALFAYGRVVQKSARREARSSRSSASDDRTSAAPQPTQGHAATVGTDGTRMAATPLYQALVRRPSRAAAAYAIGGAVYSTVMATADVALSGVGWRPVAWFVYFCIYAWPVVLTWNLVAAATRRMKLRVFAVYLLVFAAAAVLALLLSPLLTMWQVVKLWMLVNLAPTVLVLLFLNRAVRAVGPLMLAFFMVTVGGTHLAYGFALEHPATARALRDLLLAIGAPGHPILAVYVIGIIVLSPVWWALAHWIRRRYEQKKISDESITVDAVWLVFLATSSGFASGQAIWWLLVAATAFSGYKLGTRKARRWLGSTAVDRAHGTTLLLLRSFSVGRDSERLFDALEKHWRRVGSINLIVGADLARRTVEPHEFLDFLALKLARRYITGPEPLARRLSEMDAAPDRDGRFRVNDFFCHADTWQLVASTLVALSDVVLMDLRGFSDRNAGCIFEIREIARLVPLQRVVFLVDDRTDQPLLQRCLTQGGERGRARIWRLRGIRDSQLRRLCATLAVAAAEA